jgi:hypothetical protein
VRDVTGDGGVLKRRLQEGEGEFPVDCPLHDTTVRLHYRLRSLAGGVPGPWLYDSRSRSSSSTVSNGSTTAAAGNGSGSSSEASPVEVDTGCGELPEGLELVVKLMVPGELASATATPHYAYEVSGGDGWVVGGKEGREEGRRGAERVGRRGLIDSSSSRHASKQSAGDKLRCVGRCLLCGAVCAQLHGCRFR